MLNTSTCISTCPRLDSDSMGSGIVYTTSKDSSVYIVIAFCMWYYVTQIVSCCIGNHRAILTDAGYTDIREYRYFKKETRGLDYEGMMKDLKVKTKATFCFRHHCGPLSVINVDLNQHYMIVCRIIVLCYAYSECSRRCHLHNSRLCSQSNRSWPQQGAMEGHNERHESKPKSTYICSLIWQLSASFLMLCTIKLGRCAMLNF